MRAIIGLDASPAMVAATQRQANAERFLREDAFIFPTKESALLYYSSGMVEFIADPPEDGSHRNKLCERVGDAIEDIIRREGAFRVGKNSGCFVARLLAME